MSGLQDLEAEILGTKQPFLSQPFGWVSSNSVLFPSSSSKSSVSRTRSRRTFFDVRGTCFLCEEPLGDHRDIFMYRGDSFCSKECRLRQMAKDETSDRIQINPSDPASVRMARIKSKLGKKFDTRTIFEGITEVRDQCWTKATHPRAELENKQKPICIAPSETLLEAIIEKDMKFDRSLNIIMGSMGNSDIGKIGIYGRAGIGKSTLLETLRDQPMVRRFFESVIWVKVSMVWRMIQVQQEILRQLASRKIDHNEHINSQGLFNLLNCKKFLLILDDVCEFINLEMMGIPKPTPENGCKIILTTRLEQICDQMAVDWKVRLEDLLSWELFCQNVGEIVDSSPSVQPLARRIVEMCCHCSHAIILVARALKDACDIRIWNNVLETLSKEPVWVISHQDKLEIIMINALKFSYECLPDDITRKCLRNCVQLFQNQVFKVALLIDSWIADGLIDNHHKGNQILDTLTSANLLRRTSGSQFVELEETYRHILVDHIILPEEGRLFLMQGGMRLTETPKVEEWESSKVIYLMDNELSVLPENPRCLILEALFLQRNCKLREIPPSFFHHMPALKILNLSRTRIKSLPESVFKLVSLRRLYLNNCELLMALSPSVGELKHLEVLDLQGTEIMDLPKEIERLTNLTCLEVSFCEPMNHRRSKQSNPLIPCGMISALSQLEELSIDASPDDEWWNACVEDVVSEVCHLPVLNTLKFYFPRVELLRYFKWYDAVMADPPLSHFRFTVGCRVKRIISRLPSDIEFELERYARCLKYVNGTAIPGDIKQALRHATAIFLDRHVTIRKLSEFGYGNLKQLKCCVVGECNELQAIIDGDQIEARLGDLALEYLHIYYMKNLRSIWEGPLHDSGLFVLKFLTLRACPQLTTIFTSELLRTLICLEELTVDDCPEIINLVACYKCEDVQIFPRLKKVSLHYLPRLVGFSECLVFVIAPISKSYLFLIKL
ncbi:probable disease resistance protein At4g27220 [Hevea brasiliensis]|uniref:probable disease resistance protein At4g27220 n=1 Tax=Hevea brasiliensis TaxID=3981 RepID=UPI0025FCD5D1|nr:probable disease resistance protein At4g27220 [Hevea brasiliensis]